MPRLVTPVDSAYSGVVSVRCPHPSQAKISGDGRRPSMNLGLSLLVKARTQVLPAHPRTKANLLLSAARSRPWSLERQSREGCRGPLSFEPCPFILLSYSLYLPHFSYPPNSPRIVSFSFSLMTIRIMFLMLFVKSRFTHFPLAFNLSSYCLSFCSQTHTYPSIRHSTHPLVFILLLSIAIVNHSIEQ